MLDEPITPTPTLAEPAVASGPMPAPTPAAPISVPDMAPPDITPGVNPAIPPAPPAGGTPGGTAAPPPHAKLLAMVQGLSIGLGAAAQSIATHGKEGGAPEVIRIQGEQQRQKLESESAATAKKSAKLQQDLMQGEINHINTLNIFLAGNVKNEMALSDMSVAEKQLAVTKEKFDLWSGTGMNQQQIEQMMAGGPVDAKTSGLLRANAARQAKYSGLPADNSAITGLNKLLTDPNVKPQDLIYASNQVAAEEAGQQKLTEMQIKKQQAAESSPIGIAEADNQNKRTEERYRVLNPGKPLPDEFKVTADSTPIQLKRITDGLKDTEAAKGIAEQRASTEALRQISLDALRGPQGIDPSLQGPDYLAAVATKDPGQADMIKAYGQGRMVLSPMISRTPQGQALAKQILRAYPNYIAANAEGYQKQYNEFTSGKIGTSINSYKTSLDHLNAAFDNVSNASVIDLNNPASKVHQQLDVDKNYLSTELAKAVSNGNMTEGEKLSMEKAIDGKILGVATKDKYLNQLRENVRLLQGKLGAFQSQWASTAVPGSEPPSNLADAAAATQKLAGGAVGGTPAPAGATGKGKAADGNWYYHDAQGNNLGRVQ